MTAINILIKIAFISLFVGLLYLVLDYFISILQANLNLPFLDLFSYLGLIQAIQVLISFAIASFIANQVISYFRSA
jgi:hypothetical protein